MTDDDYVHQKMIAPTCLIFFASCVTVNVGSSHGVVTEEDDPCKNRTIIFNTTSDRGNMTHRFRLPSTDVLFSTKNDSTRQTLECSSNVKDIDISFELNFFSKQYRELKRLSSLSSTWYTRIDLVYTFDTSTRKYNFSFITNGVVASFSLNGHATVKTSYQSDRLVTTYANGHWVDRLRNQASSLEKKWTAFCKELEANKSRATISPHTPATPAQTLTRVISKFTDIPDELNTNATDDLTNALSATATGSIVTFTLLAMVVAPIAFVFWRWRAPLRDKFEKVTTL